ncbi:MAG: hypothetical protein NC321_10975 [Clostridium sp.]|nr:hypothetical protein [Clostridium sp.]
MTKNRLIIILLLSAALYGCSTDEESADEGIIEQPTELTEASVPTQEAYLFTDNVIKEKINEVCNGKLDREHLEAVTVLHLLLTKEDEEIAVLNDLALLPNLQQLYIEVQPECERQMVLDYGYLENMTELTDLIIHDEHLTDISFVKQMTVLHNLDVSDCNIKDIKPLLECGSLTNVDLRNNKIEDYTGIEYLPELDKLSIGGNPGDFLQVLRKRGAEVLTASDKDKEIWKAELEKAFVVYNPLLEKGDEFNCEVEDWCVEDFNGDGIDDLGVVIGKIDDSIAEVPIQRRLYLYLGNKEGYEEPLKPLPIRSDYGWENPLWGFTMRDGKVFVKNCFESEDILLTDMEIYEYRDEKWQYVLYTSDQKQDAEEESQEAANCYGVYDFENDSFAVYTWRYAVDDKGEYVKRWGNSLSDVFVYYDRIPYDEGEDGYKWISIVNPYFFIRMCL